MASIAGWPLRSGDGTLLSMVVAERSSMRVMPTLSVALTRTATSLRTTNSLPLGGHSTLTCGGPAGITVGREGGVAVGPPLTRLQASPASRARSARTIVGRRAPWWPVSAARIMAPPAGQ